MNINLTLPIFFKPDNWDTMKIIDKEPLMKDCLIKQMVFYNISCIGPFKDDDDNYYTSIHSNGSEFVCQLKFSEVKKLIECQLEKK